DRVRALALYGNETVMEALVHDPGLTDGDLKDCHIWLARPDKVPGNPPQVLPVDWNGIGIGNMTTNYILEPKDELHVGERLLGSLDSWKVRRTESPLETIWRKLKDGLFQETPP